MKAEWKIQAILEPELEQADQVGLVRAWAAQIAQKKAISSVVKALAAHFPLCKAFLFLKRVKISPKEPKDEIQIIVKIGEEKFTEEQMAQLGLIEGLIIDSLVKVEIPEKQPRIRAHFELSKAFWPCHFHEDKRLEAVLGQALNEIWGEEAFERHCNIMQRVLSQAEEGNFYIFYLFIYFFERERPKKAERSL